jgi:restriction system protein
MAIPDFQTIMLPLLDVAADGQEHAVGEVVAALADHFKLSPDELAQMLPSGTQRTFSNRTQWATSYLRNAGLLETTGRGRFRITAEGQAVVAKKLERVDIKFLMQYPAFVAFRAGSGKTSPPATPAAAAEQTPEEAFESAYRSIRTAVEQDLLARTKQMKPSWRFEQLVLQLMLAMGYGGPQEGAGHVTAKSGDEGVDGVINEDRLGLDTIYLQAKRWEAQVGRPLVQAFAGSLDGKHARKGVMITTSTFSPNARAFVAGIEKKIVLIDGAELARLMFEHNVGVADAAPPYVLKRVDLDFFEEA